MNNMKTKVISIIGLFVLLALGTLVFIATEVKAEAPVSFESAAQGYIVPMAGSCSYFCSKCIPIGHNGACTSAKVCC